MLGFARETIESVSDKSKMIRLLAFENDGQLGDNKPVALCFGPSFVLKYCLSFDKGIWYLSSLQLHLNSKSNLPVSAEEFYF